MKKLINAVLFTIFYLSFAEAQIQIKGIINNYYKIIEVDTCFNVIRTASVHSFNSGDKVLVMQMKGAQINESNTAAFGTPLYIGGAGAYEVNTIDSVFSDGFRLKNALRYPYDPLFSVQVISVPKFDQVLVIDTLTAKPWDGSTGGILVLDANRLELNAPIVVSGRGFRAGKSLKTQDPMNNCSWLVSVADYHLPRNSWRGAEKGEGIAEFIPGKEGGRGAQLNGGGGGNDHNSGGGGGANVKKGGQGGRNDDPGGFNCQGPNPGAGGKAIGLLNAFNRFFPGGGGGAGHGNNGLATDGGSGGGIVFLFGKSLVSNGYKIIANGSDAKTTYGDGGGGGGAGGTIVFDMASVNGQLPIFEAKGGKGADIDNRSEQRCFGPGGGGSGGRIIYTYSLNAVENVSGGIHGMSSNGSCQNSTNGAQQGDDGIAGIFSFLNTKGEPFVPLAIVSQPLSDTVCLGTVAKISIKVVGKGLKYQWQRSFNGGVFSDVPNNAVFTGSLAPILSINNFSASIVDFRFRCVITSICGQMIVSEAIRIYPDSIPQINFTLSVNRAQVICTNKSTGATDYIWDFGDGNSSTYSNPAHTYTMDGKYSVGLKASNRCGVVFRKQDIEIVTPNVASFRADTIKGCAPLKVHFINTSSENVLYYYWRFEGGDIAVSTEKNPVVTYEKEGRFDVTLIVQNSRFSDSIGRKSYINVSEKPIAEFSHSFISETKVKFTNNSSSNASGFKWNTSSGFSTSEREFELDFIKDGTYEVTLTASNSCGDNSVVVGFSIETLPKAGFDAVPKTGCVPMTVAFNNLSSVNSSGWRWKFPGAVIDTSSAFKPTSTYNKPGVYDVLLIAFNRKGGDTTLIKGVVIVEDKPEVSFDVKTNKLNAEFQNLSTNFSTVEWTFGFDGKTSSLLNPSILFPKAGTYAVNLVARNKCGERKTTREIAISDELSCGQIEARLVPNPVTSLANIKFNARRMVNMPYILSTVDGKVINRGEVPAGDELFALNMEYASSGLYIFHYTCQEKVHALKILKIDY